SPSIWLRNACKRFTYKLAGRGEKKYNTGRLWRGRIVWPSARAWKARNLQGFEGSNPSLSALSTEYSCVEFASSETGSRAAGHCELRQDRKVAAVSGPSWVTWGCLVTLAKRIQHTNIFCLAFTPACGQP